MVARSRPSSYSLWLSSPWSHRNWEQPQAATWILTGIPPAAALIVGHQFITSSGYEATTRIVLAIDPAASGPDVERFYRSVRGRRERRSIKAKNAALAAFICVHRSGTWRERMGVWNARYPRWPYKAPSNFGRDARSARRRLLAPNL